MLTLKKLRGVWVLAAAAILLGCSQPEALFIPQLDQSQAEPAPIVSEPPTGLLGVLIAEESVELSAEKAGRLVQLPVRLGQKVDKGTLLAALDDRRLQAERQEAIAALGSAQAQKASSQLAVARAVTLLRRRAELRAVTPTALSQDEWERTILDEQAARAHLVQDEQEIHQRQARLLQAEAALAATIIRAPWPGVVAACYVAEGATVSAGQPLVRLLGRGPPLLRFAAPESTSSVRGQTVCLTANHRPERWTAHITQIAPEVDEALGMIVMEARLDTALPPELRLGIEVRVTLRCEEPGHVIP